VDGRTFVEDHGDGGASLPIFFRPPYVPPGERAADNEDLAGVELYLLVAGKLYADAEPLRARSVRIGARSVSTMLHSQTRGELQRLYLYSRIQGMSYHLAAIPPESPAPPTAGDFRREAMTALFNEGYGLAAFGAAWRRTPPGMAPGESPLQRSGTNLMDVPRGPGLVRP
jgi:hypothetical protein